MCIYVHVSVKPFRTLSIWFSGTPVTGFDYLDMGDYLTITNFFCTIRIAVFILAST